MAIALARLGFCAIIIEGRAPEDALYHLVIDREGTASLVDATDCHRMGNYVLAERLLNNFGNRNAISSIGPAGKLRRRGQNKRRCRGQNGLPCRP
jgi:aldehyde:ferredoxin oxidoreductase